MRLPSEGLLTTASPGLDRGCLQRPPTRRGRGQYAPGQRVRQAPGSEIEQLRADLHGRWRQAARAVMVLLSAHGLAAAQIAELLDCHPATVRRWISRFNREGPDGLADRP